MQVWLQGGGGCHRFFEEGVVVGLVGRGRGGTGFGLGGWGCHKFWEGERGYWVWLGGERLAIFLLKEQYLQYIIKPLYSFFHSFSCPVSSPFFKVFVCLFYP